MTQTQTRERREPRRFSGLRGALAALAALCALGAGAAARDAGAYSYAEGKAEPVIDAREATLAALESGDFAAARTAFEAARPELKYLDENFGTRLGAALERALAARDAKAVDRVYLDAFATSVRRRISAAGENLQDYQSAKILVVRSKRLLDLLSPHLVDARRAPAQQALAGCLAAIGNPGVFGVGTAPADPAAFAANSAVLLSSLELR